MQKLSGKYAMVTGGRQGIGRAIVDAFTKEGADVWTCGRGERPDDLPNSCGWYTLDVGDSQAVNALAEVMDGYIDVLVNNAGVQVEKKVVDSTDDDWDAVIGANCKGVFNMCRAIIPKMNRGCIINIGSISGQHADPSMALYNASKAFVHGLTRSIAVDYGHHGIRCNAICPGWIETGMLEAGFDLARNPKAAQADAILRHPVGRFGKPEDVASMAVWLASDESSFASGQLFTVDGGMTAASPLNPGLF
ncbi:MAG: SDR family oxidoreductase [Pseudomonadota bacterium]